jgi:hypothetical protein
MHSYVFIPFLAYSCLTRHMLILSIFTDKLNTTQWLLNFYTLTRQEVIEFVLTSPLSASKTPSFHLCVLLSRADYLCLPLIFQEEDSCWRQFKRWKIYTFLKACRNSSYPCASKFNILSISFLCLNEGSLWLSRLLLQNFL